MTHLQVKIKRKYFESTAVEAIRDLSFEVGASDIVAIVGPSGSGKSTLLNIVGGLDEKFDGELRFNHQSREISCPRIGFVFQSPRLMPWLNVIDNIRLVLDDADEDSATAREVLERVGLREFGDAYPAQLSGGMQRRIALARAFAIEPQLLLLDEPFVSLDSPTATQLRQWLVTLCEQHKPTVLLITHDCQEALSLSDRVLFLSDSPGRVVLDYRVPLSWPRGINDRDVLALQAELLERYPQLLTGIATGKGE